jgi:hypothetical protein
MIKKVINKIKEDYREFVSARKRIEELQIQNTSLLQNNAELWHDNVSSFAHYIENIKKTSYNISRTHQK